MARKKETVVKHEWKKVRGKYHTREGVIMPGMSFMADEDTFKNDPAWQYIGPVEVKEEAPE